MSSNDARGFSRFFFVHFDFANVIDRAARRLARGAHTAPSLGPWPPATPHGLGPHPGSYKTGAKNIYDQKIPKVQGICYCFACLKPHGLFRFPAGDHYGKGKSIRK
jgi:hypothetical protein